ncbi:MAG: DUF2905 domain-containing protein [Planctomycetales bacterium]|nr:DUF2905 domain-containing protein [Planctomycetales bacterium]
MPHPAWTLIIVGLLLAGGGVVWLLLPAAFTWIGRLPGDIRIEGEHGRFYFPLTTCILVSVVLSAVLWLMRQLAR